MEETSNKLQNAIATIVGTPHFLSTSLPTSFIQFPQPAVLPLGTLPGIGGIVSVSSPSHPMLSSLHHQHQVPVPIQRDPLVLVPASALSPSTIDNVGASASILNTTKLQPASFPYNHQLLLNNAQVPVVVKTSENQLQLGPAIQTAHLNQSFIVLPIGDGSEHLTHSFENCVKSNLASNSFVQKNQKGECKNSNHGREETIQSKCNASDSNTNKVNPTEVITKSRQRKKNKGAVVVHNNEDTKNITNSSEDNISNISSNEPNLDFTHIISQLPSDWQVIGITGMNQIRTACPSSLSTFSSDASISSEEAHCDSKKYFLTTEIKDTPHDQPSLVSVNLNSASLSAASKTVLSESSTNGSFTCSVKLDDIPCTHVISVETECPNNEGSNKTLENITDLQDCEKQMNGDLSKSLPIKSDAGKKLQELENKESYEFYCPIPKTMLPADLNNTNPMQPALVESQTLQQQSSWTVVGVTALPPLSSTNTVTISQSNKSSLLANLQEIEKMVVEKPSLPTILKIPMCTPVVSPPSSESKKKEMPDAVKNIPMLDSKSLSNSTGDSYAKMQTDDVKWTIVGVLGSTFNTSSTECENSGLANVPGITLGSNALSGSQMIVSPSQQSPVPSQNSLKAVNSSTLNSPLLPLTDVGPLLPLTSLSSSQSSPPPEAVRKRKSKSEKPVSKSPCSKMSPSRDDHLQNSCNTQSDLQSNWKVIGVTPLGIPPLPSNPLVSLSQLTSLSSAIPVPFLVSEASASSQSTSTVSATSSLAPLPSSPSPVSSLVSSPSPSSFPVFNLAGNSGNSSMISPVLASSSPTPTKIQSLQELVHQQSLSQLLHSQLTTYQNPVNVLTLNEPNQWSVVGLIANNQVSLLNSTPGTPAVSNSPALVANITDSASNDASAETMIHKKSKTNLASDEVKQNSLAETTTKSVTIRQSLASRLKSESESRFYHFKCKDVMGKQDHVKMKKNTVSNLLKMKRLQQKTHENGSSEEGDHSFEEAQQVFSQPVTEIPSKKAKTRSLRSYAGNRKLFTKLQTKDEKISLRSGTQVPVPHYKSEEDEMSEGPHMLMQKEEDHQLDEPDTADTVNKEARESSIVKIEAYSSARRRKLKVPRKMIADLDYHPFDSSSDSN